MKMTAVRDREIAAVSLRRACDMRRAWRPGNESPMSPSISARGTSAATESTMMTSTAFDLTSASHISSACSPVSGWEMRRSSMLIPIAPAKVGSSACSTSMYADSPPARCACAITCIATVDLPAISRPKKEARARVEYEPKYEYSEHWGEVEQSHAWKNLADRSEDGLRDLVDDVVERIVRIVADPRQDNPGKHRY